MERRTDHGFTLIELLVGLAVAGILLAVGAPSFVEAVRESKISSQYNRMVGSLYLARSEAVKGPDQVTICPRESKGANTWEPVLTGAMAGLFLSTTRLSRERHKQKLIQAMKSSASNPRLTATTRSRS